MKTGYQTIPDPEIGLRDSRDFLMSNSLTRKAFSGSTRNLPNFVSDLIESIYRLVQSCHLPEFTDHGLPHLCSLIDRICRWELKPSANAKYLVDSLVPREAQVLLLATLIHDIGMLSQNPLDMPGDSPNERQKPNWSDISNWVRVTHVDRLRKLAVRIMSQSGHDKILKSGLFDDSVFVAESHQLWPWDWNGKWSEKPNLRGLAAVVAVSDLLDEDSARCDTTTLLQHREGSQLNKAHWLRHALTENRILVESGKIKVDMVRPPNTSEALRPVFGAIRNHFKLVMLYESELANLDADINNIEFSPSTGIPPVMSTELSNWQDIHGFATESALCFQLLRTFMAEALKDSGRYGIESEQKLMKIALEDVDLQHLENCRGKEEPRTELEQNFAAFQEVES